MRQVMADVANIAQARNCLGHTSAAVDTIFCSSRRTAVEDCHQEKFSAPLLEFWKILLSGGKKPTSYTNRALSITGFASNPMIAVRGRRAHGREILGSSNKERSVRIQ
jgi:hypothetical protein